MMVLTPSTMVALEAPARDFRLPDPAGREWPPTAGQTASVGCNIKWKPGRAPEWFGA